MPQASSHARDDSAPVEAPEISAPAGPGAADYPAEFGHLADQAAAEGYQGLQEACLLLVEALNGREAEETWAGNADFPALLTAWPALFGAYRREPLATAGAIMEFLRHPALNLPLSDEEFALIEAMLAEGAGMGGAGRSSPEEAGPAIGAGSDERAEEGRARLRSLPRAARELVELLLRQAESIEAGLRSVSADDPDSAAEGLPRVREELERFARAAQTAGFEGLAQASGHVDANLRQCLEGPQPFTPGTLGLLRRWLDQVKAYLPAFTESEAGRCLLAPLDEAGWPVPLPREAGAAILAQLRDLGSREWPEAAEARERIATAEDVSLALPDDVNQELLDILLQELPAQTQQFSESVQRLQAGGGLRDLETAQRIAHTLKGSANTVGIRGIAVLTHHLEDILLACAREQKPPGPALAEALVGAADCLEAMSEALLGHGGAPYDARAVLQEILDWAHRIDRAGLPEDGAAPTGREAAPVDGGEAEADSQGSVAAPPPHTPAVRVPADQVENLFRLSGESVILSGQAHEQLRRMKSRLQALQAQFALLQRLGAGLEELVDLKDLSGGFPAGGAPGFDALEMDQYGALHTTGRRLAETAADARAAGAELGRTLESMDEVLDYQQRLAIDTQNAALRMRLVPIASIAPRLHRSLRQTCRLTGKPADLALSGENLPIDGGILDALSDPLMHLLRNAVDHGLESPEGRLKLGKPRRGRIAIAFDREGHHILVRCRDDGRGLDFAAIRAAAERRGALQPGQDVTEDELKRFVLRPGFSTRAQSTQTSGRGVGLDAVHARILSLGGSLALDSSPGHGLAVELRVPLPLSRSHALLAQVGPHRVAIANRGLAQIFYSGDGELKDLGHGQALLLGDEFHPAVKLGDLLRFAGPGREPPPHGAVLLVRHEGRSTAVLVDAITDSREVVIKNLGHYLPRIPGFIGATILGDGTVTPVVDIPELLRLPVRAAESAPPETAAAIPAPPTVLVVDDSLSQRRALEQLLADAGYRVRTARDGLEAVEALAHGRPDIVLTDLEMPRMNGLELAARIRAQAGGRALPIIMITSRTTPRHRELAEAAGIDDYLAKPVRDDELLDRMHSLMGRMTGHAREASA